MPAKSEEQAKAARLAYAAKKGKVKKSFLTGAALQMFKSMSLEQLKEFMVAVKRSS